MIAVTDNSWRRVVAVLRTSAWRLNTSPRFRQAFARDLADAAETARASEARPIREAADGLADFAERAGRRRSWRWIREGARVHALQLANLIEHEQEQSMAKVPKKAAKKAPAKKVRAAAAQLAPAKTTKAKTQQKKSTTHAVAPPRAPAVPRLWGLAAFIAAQNLAFQDVWDWFAPEAGAARILAMRVEGTAAQPKDETFKLLARPSGFTTWQAFARDLEEAVVWSPHRARGAIKGACRVSPYAVVIADDERHVFFDPRGRLEPTSEMVASVDQVGILDSVKLQRLVEKSLSVDYVSDGRQRINTVRRVNIQRLRQWFERARAAGDIPGNVPPELILEVSAEVLEGTVAEAQRAGGVLNAKTLRRDDTLRDQAYRAPQLRAAGYKREEIAVQLGVSMSSVTNLLALQQLTETLRKELWDEVLAPASAYILATQEAKHQHELWELAKRLPVPRRARYLRDLVTAEAKVEELRAVVEGGALGTMGDHDRKLLAEAQARLDQIRSGKTEVPMRTRGGKDLKQATERLDGLSGEGPRLVRAALAFAQGGCSLKELLQLLAGSTATVVGPLAVECPDCFMPAGEACVDDDLHDVPVEACEGRMDAAAKLTAAARANVEFAGDGPGTVTRSPMEPAIFQHYTRKAAP